MTAAPQIADAGTSVKAQGTVVSVPDVRALEQRGSLHYRT